MAYKYEPRVVSREQVIAYTEPSTSFTDLGNLTYVQLVSDTGPTDMRMVNGFTDLLNLYTFTGSLQPSSSKSLLEAAYLSKSSPLLVKRVTRSAAEVESKKLSLDKNYSLKLTPKYPSVADYLKITVTPAAKESTFNITIAKIDPNNPDLALNIDTYSSLSPNIDSVNANGASNFIGIINDYRDDVKIEVEYTETLPADEGDESDNTITIGKVDNINVISGTDWSEGYSELRESDTYRVTMIYSSTVPSDSGITQSSANQFAAEAGAQPDYSSTEYVGTGALVIYSTGVVDWEESINLESISGLNSGVIVAHGFSDSSLLGSVITLEAGLLYHAKICSNTTAGKPYAPIMGTQNGLLPSNSNIVPNYTSSERNDLLNAGIMVIRSNKNTGLTYFLDDITLRSPEDPDELSQGQNRRLFNKIRHDIDDLLDNFIGQFNIEETRDKVEQAITDYFTDNIMILSPFTIRSFSVQCDEYNNPTSVVKSRLLKVIVAIGFNNSIRNIEVLYKVVPVG